MSDRSYVIGGVGPGDWGQNVNETLLTQIVGPSPTPVDTIGQIERHFMRMPLEALQVFEPFIPGARSGDFTNTQSAVETIMNTIIDNPLNGGVQGAVLDLLDKIKEIINSIVNGWQGTPDGQWDPFNVYITMEEIAAAFGLLQSQINEFAIGGNNGVAVTENFNQYPNGGLGSKWISWHEGLAAETISIKDARMWLFCFPLATRHGWAKYTDKETLTDYQRVSAVFGSKPASGLFNQTAFNYLMGRVAKLGDTPTTTTHVFAKLGANQAHIGVNIRGTETILKSAPSFSFNPAANYTLQCGVKGKDGAPDQPRTFRLFEGNNQILEAFDPTGLSFVGNTHRYTGLGFSNASALQSAKVASFVMFDSK